MKCLRNYGNALLLLLTPFVLLHAGCTEDSPTAPELSTTVEAPTQDAAKAGPVILYAPGEHPGGPLYANLAADFIPTDDGVVGILFQRNPDCVPATFNLLLGFDVPGAFACDLIVAAKLWFSDPATDPVPYQIQQWGTDVPVYFVDRDEFDAAAAGGLTIVELNALPSLRTGYTHKYRETVHNSNKGSRDGHSVLNARGTLEDGRSFRFHYNERFDPDTGIRTINNVVIDIGT